MTNGAPCAPFSLSFLQSLAGSWVSSPTGGVGRRNALLGDAVLQALGRTELGVLLGSDVDRLAGSRVAAHTGPAPAGVEGAEPGDPHFAVCIQLDGNDPVAGVTAEDRVDDLAGLRLGQVGLLGELVRHLGLVHSASPRFVSRFLRLR